ncbi:uncharacterized protein [Prorops nasuta]|uniref:uncharacterized protein isoform X3 n=1 Tax=Prorops nasuta TaxID=863751 RepID=UPI0034D0090E
MGGAVLLVAFLRSKSLVVWLTAVLCPRLAAANNLTISLFSRKSRERPFKGHISRFLEDTTEKRMNYREMQMLLREEAGENGLGVDCCPSIQEMVEPLGGRNREDIPDVLDKPCRFVDRKFSNQSRCVQKFSYSYAIIENLERERYRHHHSKESRFPPFQGDTAGGKTWALDYVRVRSGCSCEITPKPKKKKHAQLKAKKAKSKQRLRLLGRDSDQDFELET